MNKFYNYLGLTLAVFCLAIASAYAVADKVTRMDSNGKMFDSVKTENPNSQRVIRSNTGLQPAAPAGLLRVPAMRQEAPMRLAGLKGKFFGVVSDFLNPPMAYTTEAYFASLDLDNGTSEVLFKGKESQFYWPNQMGELKFLFAGTERKGGIYTTFFLENMVTHEITLNWMRTDIATGECEPAFKYSFETNPEALVYAMTYDSGSDSFYGISVDAVTMQPGVLVKVDGKTGNISTVGVMDSRDGFISGIYYHSVDKKLYGLRANNHGMGEIVSISTQDAKITIEGETDEYAIPFFRDGSGPMAQPLTFSPRDNAFIAMVLNPADGMNVAYKIDAETFEPEYLCTFSTKQEYIPVLYCADAVAAAEAPAAADIKSLEFNKAELSGQAKIGIPTELYNGAALTKNVTAAVYVNDALYQTYENCVPGSELSVDLNMQAEGYYKLDVYTYLQEDEPSPAAERWFYAGNDNPKAPANVRLEGSRLTWDAPGSVGEHDGYVDTQVLSYDIYLNGEKMNTTPVTNREYNFTFGSDLAKYQAAVVAVANGKESKQALSNGIIGGDPLSIPVTFTPTPEEAGIFTIVNQDKNQYGWVYNSARKEFCIDFDEWGKDMNNKDWLFLPFVNFDDNGIMYDFSYDIVDAISLATSGVVKAYIGKDCTPEAMTTLLSEETDLQTNSGMGFEKTTRSTTFALPSGAGVYFIGLCYESRVNVVNISLNNINIKRSARSTAAPGTPSAVTVKADVSGGLEATVEWVMPTVSTIGEPLNADKDITMQVATKAATPQAVGKPGTKQSVKVGCVQGFNTFALTPSNEYGTGFDFTTKAFVGKDKPLPVTNVWSETSEDNSTIDIHWDAPTEGENGGFIDTENMTYNIYAHSSINYTLVGSTSETHFAYNPMAVRQDLFTVGPVAVSAGQPSQYGTFVQDMLGNPHKAPIFETFSTVAGALDFDYGPWKFSTNEEFNLSMWEILTSLNSFGIDKAPEDVVLTCFSSVGVPCQGQLMSPKIDTRGYNRLNVNMLMYNNNLSPELEILGRRFGEESMVSLHKVDRTKLENDAWGEYSFELPADFVNCPWIQLFITVSLQGDKNSVFALDEFSITSPDEYDCRVKNMTGSAQTNVGDMGKFEAEIENVGKRSIDGKVNFSLYVDGKKVETKASSGFSLMPRNTSAASVEFDTDPSYIDKNVVVKAEINASQDVNPNNDTAELIWVVSRTNDPIITDMQGEWDDTHAKVNLSWSEPDLKYGGIEGFESYPEFSYDEKIGPWINIDEDGQAPFAIAELAGMWPDYEKAKGWQVINAETLGVMDNARLCPHSGKQYLMAMSCSYDEETEEPTQSADWLISPEVIGGTEVAFWMGSIDAKYSETIEVYYSTTDQEPSSFKKIRNFTKEGNEAWEYVSFKLPNTAKYFALKYASWGMFGAMVDDLTYTPRRALNWTLEGYNVYRNNEMIAEGLQTTNFTDETIGDNNAVYYVRTCANLEGMSKECAPSNRVRMWSTSVDEMSLLKGVFGADGAIKVIGHEGKTMAVYGVDGAYMRSVLIGKPDATVPMPAGIYLVKIDNAIAKVLVR